MTNFTVWFALVFFLYLQTESVFVTAMLSGFYTLVTALSGFWFGSLIDNHKKKTMMMLSSAVSFVLFTICFVIYLLAGEQAFTQMNSVVLWVFSFLLLTGVLIGNIRTIAIPTLVTILVNEKVRDRANGLAGTASGISFLITSVFSGLLVGHSGMYLVLILAIALTLLSIIHLLFIDIPEKGIVHAHDEQPKKIDIKGTIAVISKVPGLFPLIFFTMLNNFIGGVFMSLMDPYGLSLVSVEIWGFIWGFLSTAFIIGGLVIAKYGLGKNPLHTMFSANIFIWSICCVFTLYPSIILLIIGMYLYLMVVPYIEASEHTIIQKVVPAERQGRVFGFAQSIEQAASPLTAFAIGPIAQFIVIPFMTTGAGVELIGGWFGTGPDRGIALVFTMAGIIGLIMTTIAWNSPFYLQLSKRYLTK